MASPLVWALGGLTAAFTGLFAANAGSELRTGLSRGAEVYYPGSAGFSNATTRWSAAIRPEFEVVVKVNTEGDVQHVIKYANKHNKPFLAISGGHGQNQAMNGVKNGVGISMRSMTDVRIVDDGDAAIIGGGIQTGELLPALWSQGKQTVTTGCDCAGFIGPIMGGGHGWLQGRYGLVADQLISARMVLANGTAITVSESQHADLFWAIRGAGHNFGIYTEIKIKIYNRTPEQDEWAAEGFVYTHDKLEKLFGIMNEWLESPNRPVELTHYGVFAFNPDIDPDKPIIIMWVYWQGRKLPQKYYDPLKALGPVFVDSSVTDLGDVNSHLMAKYGMASCEKGFSRLQYAVSVDSYPLANVRATFEIFAQIPAEFRTSVVMLEAFATNRVNEIPDDSISYPDRSGKLLLAPLLTYPANASLDQTAFHIGSSLRDALMKDTGNLVAYVNYARGDESLEAVYGYDSWRLDKLRALKKEYDPHGRFNFYVPIK